MTKIHKTDAARLTTTAMTNESPHEQPFDARATTPRFLTADQPGIGGVIRLRDDDFLVEEIPLYEPAGEGEHAYIFVEKRGLSTMEMVNVIARHFGVKRRAIGTAGLKDKRAITRQVVSVHIPGRSIDDVPGLVHDKIAILWVDLHTNKLRRGHLKGNRFSIRIRQTDMTRAVTAQRVLDSLATTGVPNRIGRQRFGISLNNHLIGRAVLRQDWQQAIDLLLGPSETAPESQAEARAAYAVGNFADARALLPGVLRAERTVLSALAAGMSAREAFARIDAQARGFFVSGFQSAVFNCMLDERIEAGTLDTLIAGDVAHRHGSRDEFDVTPEVLAQADTNDRVRALELSPTGPMWGAEMRRATGVIDEAELAALRRAGVEAEQLASARDIDRDIGLGSRRPVRVPLIDPVVEGGIDGDGNFVRCAFELPRGAFATVALDEIMKNGAPDAPRDRPTNRPTDQATDTDTLPS
ncbi:MAG: tRNA pseudouridine(13) synthase TruD [Planctomycetota bacterium]